MKFTNRILATLLTLALALSFVLPTMAAVNWDEFKITKSPQNLTITNGDSFTLSVEVNVPDGVEVAYQWYTYTDGIDSGSMKPIEGATFPELHVSPSDPFYAQQAVYEKNVKTRYSCKVTAYETVDASNTKNQWSNDAIVIIKRTALGKLYDLTISPFVYAFGGTVGLMGMSAFVLIPVSPLIFLGFLIYGFFQGFIGLF